MRQRLLERPLHDRCLNDAFADFLRSFTRPLLAYYSPRASQDSKRPASSLRRNDRRFNQIEFIRTDFLEQKFAGEFAFEHPIEAYEQLIDSTFAEGKR